MSNFSKWNKNNNSSQPLHYARFVSLHDDNPNIKKRERAFLTRATPIELQKQFKTFCKQGQTNEVSYFYYSINSRKNTTIQKELIHHLIDETNVSLLNIEHHLYKIGQDIKHAETKKWCFHIHNTSNEALEVFLSQLSSNFVSVDTIRVDHITNLAEINNDAIIVYNHKSTNDYDIVVPHGFDMRQLRESSHIPFDFQRDSEYLIEKQY